MAFNVYITEPDVIDQDIVRSMLPNATLVPGSTAFTGDAEACDVALIRSATHITPEVTQAMPHLRHVVRVGTGLDNVDLTFCAQAGISVYNAPGANADAVAEYVTAMLLMCLRKVHLLQRDDAVRWNRFKFTGHGIAGRTVGIVGFGNIGRLLHRKLTALGCKDFLVYDPFVTHMPAHARSVSLEELVAGSDIVSLHVPLLPQTKHCINAKNLATMCDGAILVNAARGGIVDESALLRHLETRELTYIADTVENEPAVNPALLDNPHIIVTPHIASLTDQAEAAMIRDALQNLLDGKTAHVLPAA